MDLGYRIITALLKVVSTFNRNKESLAGWAGENVVSLLDRFGSPVRVGITRRAEYWLQNKKREIEYEEGERDGRGQSAPATVHFVSDPEHVFISAFRRRFYPYCGLALLIVVLMVYPGGPSLRVSGLVFSTLGSLIIARGLIQGVEGILFHSRQIPPVPNIHGGAPLDPKRVISECQRAADAVFGVVFLLTGFLIQLLSIL